MFIGRKNELKSLRETIESDKSSVVVIYGRRRIGKSELIRKAFENEPVLYFEGLEGRSRKDQLNNFMSQLHYQTRLESIPKKVRTWTDAFMILNDFLSENDLHHIVFDEFQWMANYRREIVTELKPVWDRFISRNGNITLILCGSIASFMTTKVVKSSGFYGRTDLVIHLRAFKISETKELLAGKGFNEVLEAHLLVGGVPKYLDLIRNAPSVRIAVERLAFSRTGYLTDEFDRIFTSHFGRNPDYEAIIDELAKHPHGLLRDQIAAARNLGLGGGLTTHLNELVSAGFISSETPFYRKSNSRLIKYFLWDSYLRFYYSFIQPNLKRIKSGIHENMFMQITQSGAYANWIGRSFEYFCIQHAGELAEILGFSGIDFTHGPYFLKIKNPTKPNLTLNRQTGAAQIDLLFDRKDFVISLCEMKYTQTPVGVNVIPEVERKVELLQKKFRNRSIQRVLISKNGVTKDLMASGYFYRIIDPEEFV